MLVTSALWVIMNRNIGLAIAILHYVIVDLSRIKEEEALQPLPLLLLQLQRRPQLPRQQAQLRHLLRPRVQQHPTQLRPRRIR